MSMIEITASDIFWIGAMDKISLGLMLTSLFCLLLIVIAVESSSVGLLLFALLLGIFSLSFHLPLGSSLRVLKRTLP
ncbi:conserved domain protein [Parasutterella excrementihominis YIT 11859]|uniref:Conserved domain protein n=1 Tax=Parasutterella excrementihominis YIT 11859 TaxID=762966 RepID=F3QNZ4_9BURK|nr:conserved domain protein [Parasutterella excrementihominis YIT 11859]